jgi:hypothetical protein
MKDLRQVSISDHLGGPHHAPSEATCQGEQSAEEERRRLGLGFGPIAEVSDLIATQGIWASVVVTHRWPTGTSTLTISTA